MEKAGDILKNLLGEANFKDRNKTASLFHSWPKMVGDRLAAHSRVKDLQADWLIICVDHPGWYQMLQFKERGILEKVRWKYPTLKIKGIKVWVEPPKRNIEIKNIGEGETERSMSGPNIDPNRDTIPGIDGISDPELKETLVKLYRDIMEAEGF